MTRACELSHVLTALRRSLSTDSKLSHQQDYAPAGRGSRSFLRLMLSAVRGRIRSSSGWVPLLVQARSNTVPLEMLPPGRCRWRLRFPLHQTLRETETIFVDQSSKFARLPTNFRITYSLKVSQADRIKFPRSRRSVFAKTRHEADSVR